MRELEAMIVKCAAIGGMQRSMLTFAIGLFLTRGALCADAPVAKVPHASIPARLDGRVDEAEWRDAAIIRGALSNPGAAVYLKYDQENLWVGVRCFETEAGYPKAYVRPPTDLLENDDSVQVVLGIADNASGDRGVINFGGYAGAAGQAVAAADYYYQFTVNAAGSTSRFFIESPLDRPLFEAKSAALKGEWDVELKIPFASWGVANPVGKSFPMNVFRFRPPAMMAWHLPGFGGYAPMPFGTMTFLPENQSAAKTVEPGAATPATAGSAVQAVDTTRVLAATLEWYPLSKKLIGQVTLPPDKSAASAVISVNGETRAKQDLAGDGPVKIVSSFTDKEKLPAEASLKVSSKSGEELLSRTVQLPSHETPTWMKTDAGRDYVDAEVPRPWTKPAIEGRTVKLYDKTIGFEAIAMPGSVVDGLGELFAGEPEIDLEIDGKPATLAKCMPALSMNGLAVRTESEQGAGAGALQIRSLVEFDGFTTVKMRLRGVAPASVSKLSIIYPLKPEYARFFIRGHLQDTQELTGFGWEGPGGTLWLGNQDKGLYFSFDTPVFLSDNPRTQMQIVEEKGRTCLRLNFVNAPGQVKDVDHIFRFFLQPTPTKKPSLAKNGLFGEKVVLWFEEWSDYQGYPDLKKMPEVAKRSAEAHKNGKQQIVYFNQLLAENSPGFQEFKADFLVPPGSMWYQRAYDPGKGVPCYLCCVRGPYGDLLLDGIRRLQDEGGIDGVYMDGTTVPWGCDNPSHPGCDGNSIVTWEGNDETRITGTREFLKRLRGIFDEKGKPLFLVAHTGGALDLPTLSLCDSYYEGEQLARYRPDYSMPLHKFAVGYCGRPWGWRTDVIPELWRQQTARLLPWTLLHDTMAGGSSGELERKIYADYSDDATVAYFPYWRSQAQIKTEKGKVLFSFYKKSDSTMLIVSNLGWQKQETVLDLGGLYPAQDIHVQDVATDRPIGLQNKKVSLVLDAHDFTALRVSLGAASEAVPEAVPEAAKATGKATLSVDRFDPAEWEFNTADAGVTVKKTNGGTRVTSTPQAAAASANFTPGIGPEGTLKIRLTRDGRFRINLAGASFFWDVGWKADVQPENTGLFYPVAPDPDKPQMLILSWKDGKLDAMFGDQPLAKGVALKGLGSEAELSFSTWAGNWFQFEVIEISSKATNVFSGQGIHPVL
jgi:hypothetical protein